MLVWTLVSLLCGAQASVERWVPHGVLGSAWLTGRSQGLTQHVQWRRQGRREAYSEFIAAVAAHREAADRLMTLMEGTHRRDDATRALERVDELFPAVRAASSVVTVEGPASVADLARKVMKGTGSVTSEVDFYVTVAHRSDNPGYYEAGRVDAALVELSNLLGKFTEAARTALDSPKV